MRYGLIYAVLLTAAASAGCPAAAQDVLNPDTVFDHTNADAQALTTSAAIRAAHGDRSRSSHRRAATRNRQKAACAGLNRFKAEHGADDPDVMRLDKLCRQHGFAP